MRCSLMMFGVLSLQGFLGTLNSNGLGVQVLAARFLHHILLHLVHGSGSIGCQRISRPVDCFGTVNWRILNPQSAHFANLPSTVTVATAQWAPAGVSLAPRISGIWALHSSPIVLLGRRCSVARALGFRLGLLLGQGSFGLRILGYGRLGLSTCLVEADVDEMAAATSAGNKRMLEPVVKSAFGFADCILSLPNCCS